MLVAFNIYVNIYIYNEHTFIVDIKWIYVNSFIYNMLLAYYVSDIPNIGYSCYVNNDIYVNT